MLDKDPLVSIIIRTKNEEEWITKVLEAIYNQTYKNFEVIIVDNDSTDTTLQRVNKFPVKITNIKKFIPGKAINIGIKESKGSIISILSGHCIPTDEFWLQNLIEPLKDSSIGGSYGRQIPTKDSSAIDKRDLLLVFGLDDKLQIKDSFFHNANSAFRREIWEKFPFCEESKNIEDRLWGNQLILNEYKIQYKADACVYHWHGIHHQLNETRAKNIVKILETISEINNDINNYVSEEITINAIIPIMGKSLRYKSLSLLEKVRNDLLKTKYVNNIIVSTDCEETAKFASELNLIPIIRPKELSSAFTKLQDVAQFTLKETEKLDLLCDKLILLEEIYPFRNYETLKNIIEASINNNIETLSAAWKEHRPIWSPKNDNYELIAGNSWSIKSLVKSKPDFVMTLLTGYATITKPKNIRNKTIYDNLVEAYPVKNCLEASVVRDQESLKLIYPILKN